MAHSILYPFKHSVRDGLSRVKVGSMTHVIERLRLRFKLRPSLGLGLRLR